MDQNLITMTYATEYREYIQALVKDYNDHPDFYEREEDARYIKCGSEGGECEEEVAHEGDLCPGCLALQVKEDAFQND